MSSSLITRPLSMGELLDVTFRIYRKHFWKLVLTAGALLVPVQVLSHLLSLVAAKSYPGSGFAAFGEGGTATPVPLWLTIPQLTLNLLSLFLAILTSAAIIWLANRILHDEAPAVTESWRAGLKYFLPYIGMALLLGIMVIVGMLLLGLLTIIPCIGILLFIVGMVFFFYIYVRFILSPMALFVEDVGPIKAIKAAWRVSAGSFWRIAGYGLLLWILGLVFYIVPVFFVQYQVLATGSVENMLVLSSVLGIVLSFLNALWTPLYLVALVVLYHDLRLRNLPDADIERRIDELEAISQISDAPEVVAITEAAPETEEAPASAPVERDDAREIGDDVEMPVDDEP